MQVKTEILAGITTFLTMSYILAVNPSILGVTGMDKGAVFTATATASLIATLIMAVWAKLPFALAPGMGLNAFFAFTVCLGMGNTWEFALTVVLIEGILFILLTLSNLRVTYKKSKKGLCYGEAILTMLIGIPMGITEFNGIVSIPPSLEPVFFKFDFSKVLTTQMAFTVFTLLFIDMFGYHRHVGRRIQQSQNVG